MKIASRLSLVLTYFLITYVGGHGIAPIGLLVISQKYPDEYWHKALTIGTVCVIGSCAIRNIFLSTGACLCGIYLYLSFFERIITTESPGITAMTSVPFAISLISSIVILIMEWVRYVRQRVPCRIENQ
jgi:hypothetical protein